MSKNQTGGRHPVGYLRAWPRIWTRDEQETNPASGQSGTKIARPTRWPLGHAAYLFLLLRQLLTQDGDKSGQKDFAKPCCGIINQLIARIGYEVVDSHCEAGSAVQLAIPISYPTRVNGIFVLLNCQPSLIYIYQTSSVNEENSDCRPVRVYCYHCRSRFP